MGGIIDGSGHDARVVQCGGLALLDREMISTWMLIVVLVSVAVLCWWELR